VEIPQGVFCGVGWNVARGITPTVSYWDTPPDHLERVTDGDLSTVTGTGTTTTATADIAGYIRLDFPRPSTGFVISYIGFWTDGTKCEVYLDQIVDGTLFYPSSPIVFTSATTEQKKTGMMGYLTDADAMRLRFYLTGGGTVHAKFYEVMVYEVVL